MTEKNNNIDNSKEFYIYTYKQDFSLKLLKEYQSLYSFLENPFEYKLPLCLLSLEKFNLIKLKVLQEYFQDLLDQNKVLKIVDKNLEYKSEKFPETILFSSKDPYQNFHNLKEPISKKRLEWLNDNLKKITMILNGKQGFYFSTHEYVYHKVMYKPSNSNYNVGRLYPSFGASYVLLPKDLRAYLALEEYVDFDLVNSHPSLLFYYATNNMENNTFPNLERYVKNREQVLKERAQVINQFDMLKVKTNIVATINSTREEVYRPGSKLWKELFEEIEPIRKHIFRNQYLQLKGFCSEKDNYLQKSDAKKEVSVQNYFLGTQETIFLCILIVRFSQNVREYMESASFQPISYDFTDRPVTIDDPLSTYFFFTPCYDGLFIGSEDPKIFGVLKQSLEDFNRVLENDGTYISLKKKPIEQKFENLNKDYLEFYEKMAVFIRSLSTKSFNQLLVCLSVPKLSFSNLDKNVPEEHMELLSRAFRRHIYGKIKQEIEDGLILDSNFMSNLKHKYRDRLDQYREHRKIPENSENETLLYSNDFIFDDEIYLNSEPNLENQLLVENEKDSEDTTS